MNLAIRFLSHNNLHRLQIPTSEQHSTLPKQSRTHLRQAIPPRDANRVFKTRVNTPFTAKTGSSLAGGGRSVYCARARTVNNRVHQEATGYLPDPAFGQWHGTCGYGGRPAQQPDAPLADHSRCLVPQVEPTQVTEWNLLRERVFGRLLGLHQPSGAVGTLQLGAAHPEL